MPSGELLLYAPLGAVILILFFIISLIVVRPIRKHKQVRHKYYAYKLLSDESLDIEELRKTIKALSEPHDFEAKALLERLIDKLPRDKIN